MKKSLLLGLSLLATCALTGCSILESLLPQGGNAENSEKSKASDESDESSAPIDSTVYGKGQENEKLVVDADIPNGEYVVFAKDIPQGERATVVVYNSARIDYGNVYFSDSNGFYNSSMVKLKPGQVVVASYCTFQNINSNPKVTKLEDGIFKVGTHFKLKNKVLKIKGTADGGRYCIYKSLEDVGGYYTHDNLTTSQITNLVNNEEEISIPYIEDGAYVEVDHAKIVVE